jgi:hypothetical protein
MKTDVDVTNFLGVDWKLVGIGYVIRRIRTGRVVGDH